MKKKNKTDVRDALAIVVTLLVVAFLFFAVGVRMSQYLSRFDKLDKNESAPKQDCSQDYQEISVDTTDTEPQYIYDIDLSTELQGYVRKLCASYNVNEQIVYGIMHVESRFNTDVTSSTGCVGIMQINPEYIDSIAPGYEYTGTTRQQIELGIVYFDYIRDFYKADTVEDALEHYNKGADITNSNYKYSQAVIDYALNLNLMEVSK